MSLTNTFQWWQSGIIYQVYPRSLQDANGDGIGDLQGILQRLDYFVELGVKTLWLSPFYPSPMYDFGYDVANYVDVNPIFGNLNDFDQLLAEAHRRDLKLIIDLVPNHTSHEHLWFIESRASRDNPKRDWYVWRDPAPDGGPPNNWISFFGGPAWTLDPTTGQYYLHQFVRQQPELNYRNPAVLEAMLDQMRFWLERGIDGFRVDVIWLMIKDQHFRDEPPDPNWTGSGDPIRSLDHIYTQDQPEVHGVIRAMRALVDEYAGCVLVGETYLPFERLVHYYGLPNAEGIGDECHLPFNFHLIQTPWSAGAIRRLIEAYEGALPEYAWPNWVLGNHDQHRIASRIGRAQARVATMLLLTLRGTPTCYYGDEIGMVDVPIPADKIMDPPAVNQPHLASLIGRDPIRTPMQWTAGPNAGFCAPQAVPWLPLAPDSAQVNVETQSGDPGSALSYFRRLTALRNASAALQQGAYATAPVANEHILAYTRSLDDERMLIVLNLASTPVTVDLSSLGKQADLLLNTSGAGGESRELRALHLLADEGLLLRLP